MTKNEVFWSNYRNVRQSLRQTPKSQWGNKLAWLRAFQMYGLYGPAVCLLQDFANASR